MSHIFKEDANSVVLGNSNAQEVTPLNRKGATSNVYIVRIDGKEHFMKQLRPQLKDDWRYRSVYRKEFEVGHSINSEYIVKYEAIGENAEGTYILMEHVNGLTLDEKIASAPEYFTKEENFEKLFVQLLHGLKALHAANVAHLDLKPENVLFKEDGTAVLTATRRARTSILRHPSCAMATTKRWTRERTFMHWGS